MFIEMSVEKGYLPESHAEKNYTLECLESTSFQGTPLSMKRTCNDGKCYDEFLNWLLFVFSSSWAVVSAHSAHE